MILITGLGPGDLDRVPGPVKSLLLDPDHVIVARTASHPAAHQLAAQREVLFCDDLYESVGTFEEVYEAIVERVIGLSRSGSVVYVVPGSPSIGEFAVRGLISSGEPVEVISSESFVDAVLFHIGYDPLDRGLQILNGHDLPDPLILDKPTIIGHLDRPEILADVAAAVDRVIVEDSTVVVLSGLGAADERVVEVGPEGVAAELAGYRTSMFVDAEPGGLVGAIRAMRRLREECPWDREQTHQTLVKYLIEETYELIDAVVALDSDPADLVTYASVEDELGDVLLSVLFHAVIARQAGVFDIDDVAEVLRQKLVRRHPHVFGDLDVASASEVKRNWDRIKESERPGERGSQLDGVPTGMPALQRASKIQNRAAKVGFDWIVASDVLAKVREEVGELAEELASDGDVNSELGDTLFSLVNLARHLHVDPELALRSATDRFERRFRHMEGEGPLDGLSLAELDQRWERAKSEQ